jgi:regulator of protease activity HflC (stomatin/prohibitin superfamily)
MSLNPMKWSSRARKWNILIISVITLFVVFLSGSLLEEVPADEIIINQVPVSGTLEFWTQPGTEIQRFGTATAYQKSFQIWFSDKEEQGTDLDEAINVVFNDGGNGWISGSIRIMFPLDDAHLRLIHTTFGSMSNIIHELVKPTVTKVVFSTGPLMNSYESYAAKKNDFIRYIEDQLRHGIYRTVSKQVTVHDEFTGKAKVITVAELDTNTTSPGGLARQEEAPFARFGLQIAAVSIEKIRYDKVITDQIASQQKAQMEVQTAIAETKKQEQQLIQEQKRGEKEATIAKWEQEVIKAKMVTEAQQKMEVAKLDKIAAEYTKQKEILLGEGEATRKRLVMQADGQLKVKLDAYMKVQQMWADAVAKYTGNWVPTTVLGGGEGGTGLNGAQTFMDIMTMKAAQDLNFKPNPQK